MRAYRILFPLIQALLAKSLVLAQPTVTCFVSTTGTNTIPSSATSWATSTSDLQGAINSLRVTGGQVWVSAGTYRPGGDASVDRKVWFTMINEVTIYGGFGGFETSLSQRSLVNPLTGSPSSTTLSGEIGDPNVLTPFGEPVLTGI